MAAVFTTTSASSYVVPTIHNCSNVYVTKHRQTENCSYRGDWTRIQNNRNFIISVTEHSGYVIISTNVVTRNTFHAEYAEKEDAMFWISTVTGTGLCCVGLTCNVFTFVTLAQPALRGQNFSLYLFVLGLFDTLTLGMSLLSSIYSIIPRLDTTSISVLKAYFYISSTFVVFTPLLNVALTGSVYVTMVLSADRCLAVSIPMRWSVIVSRTKIKLALLFVTVWSVVINIPFAFQSKVDMGFYERLNITLPVLASTEFTESQFNKIFTVFIFPFIHIALPLVVILISNVAIVAKMLSTKVKHLGSTRERHETKVNNANRMTAQVISISVLTLVSRMTLTAGYVLAIKENTERSFMCSLACVYTYLFGELFNLVNSGTNFLFYCFFSRAFRKTCLKLLCWRKQRLTSESGNRRTEERAI